MARILIVDDLPDNRLVLRACLQDRGHALLEASSGDEAVALVEADVPDLVLLDVVMPDRDGFDTTRRIKDIAGDRFLPVILVTALADHDARLEGLKAGADDFLTKPVDRYELDVRIGNLLALRAKETALLQTNTELLELHRFKDEVSALIVHDLKSPLAIALANIDFVQSHIPGAPTDVADALLDCKTSCERSLRILANLLDVARLEAGRLALRREATAIAPLLASAASVRAYLARLRSVDIKLDMDDRVKVHADPDVITRVIENMFDNALRHTPPGGRIEIGVHAESSNGRLLFGNTGPAIPVEARSLIFEKFGQASRGTERTNLGLGLYFCRLAAEAHGGRIWVDSTEVLPTVFRIELPLA